MNIDQISQPTVSSITADTVSSGSKSLNNNLNDLTQRIRDFYSENTTMVLIAGGAIVAYYLLKK
jgi:hypothetical protein